MTLSITDLVVKFIRTQEEADRLIKLADLSNDNSVLEEAERLQRKADCLLEEYRIIKRFGQ